MSNISRRRVVNGAMWAAPVVVASSLVPAYAVSACQTVSYAPNLNTSTVTRASATSATANFAPTTAISNPTGPVKPTVQATIQSVAMGTNAIHQTLNLTTAGSGTFNGLGDLRTSALELIQSNAVGYANRQVVTITFDRLVSNLQFTIADMDTGAYYDQVALSGSPQITNASNISGAGTSASPLGAIAAGGKNSDNTTSRSLITYPTPVRTVTIEFWSKSGTDSQEIFLTGLSFNASTCPA